VSDGLRKRISYPTSACFYHCRDSENYDSCSKIYNAKNFPEYLEHPFINYGFDIALALLQSDFPNIQNTNNCFLSNVVTTETVQGDRILVIGYPADKNGKLFMMEGNIKEIRDLGNDRKIILYDNINTSGGQSGSPVFLKREEKLYLIGIHVGYDSSEGVNIATAITKSIQAWITTTAFELL